MWCVLSADHISMSSGESFKGRRWLVFFCLRWLAAPARDKCDSFFSICTEIHVNAAHMKPFTGFVLVVNYCTTTEKYYAWCALTAYNSSTTEQWLSKHSDVVKAKISRPRPRPRPHPSRPRPSPRPGPSRPRPRPRP